MTSAVFRRGSSKEGLKNLLRLTAQRSIEDEEEIARERRRRAREARRYDEDDNGSYASNTSTPVFESHLTTKENQYVLSSKSTNSALDEDEGFSDWTQRREERRQKRREELGFTEEDHVNESAMENSFARERREQEDQRELGIGKLKRWQVEEEEERRVLQREQKQEEANYQQREYERKQREKAEMERAQKEDRQRLKYLREERERLDQDKMENERWTMEIEKRPKENEVKLSSTARSWTELHHYEVENDDVQNKTTPYHSLRTAKTTLSEIPDIDEDGELARLEAEQKLLQIRRSLDEKEMQDFERLRQQGHNTELELEELRKRREDRRKAREEEELRRQQQEHELQVREEEEKRRMREEREKRRMEAAEKRHKVLSISGSEMEDPFLPLSPRSPTYKISERTESLNRSLKKSNSVKKSQPITNISKIDDRLEQYTNAIESTTKSLRHTSLDIPSLSEDVATMKNLWETGDAASSTATRGTPSKDTDGLKVGVGDLINQWVSKNPESSVKTSPSKPAEIKTGDVKSKKNIWENKSDSHSFTKLPNAGKNHPSSARYKFVTTGHGKYEKVPISDDEHDTNEDS
ncbi:uncharacterized protein [Hemitrygon akajei]|uniref:uncharacterized protein isoform X2 n=1 Tax=Hemitrygon akajei TaxID=2704970 RepID=UPI003BF95D06